MLKGQPSPEVASSAFASVQPWMEKKKVKVQDYSSISWAIFLCVSQGPNRITFPHIPASGYLWVCSFWKSSGDKDNTDSGSQFPGWHDHICTASSSMPFKTHEVSLHKQGTRKVRQKAENLINAFPKTRWPSAAPSGAQKNQASTPFGIAGTSKKTQFKNNYEVNASCY